MGWSQCLVHFDNQQAAEDKFAQQSQSGPPPSANAWTGAYEQRERGLIVHNQA